MRVQVSMAACVGHSQRGATAPDVYQLDDGSCAAVAPDPREHAVDGANVRPENAITIIEEKP